MIRPWHLVVPVKRPAERKTRLRSSLAPATLDALTERMLDHVLDVATRAENVACVTLLAAERYGGWGRAWFRDLGNGLNGALTSFAQSCPDRLAIIHADLPALCPADIEALLCAGETGMALASNRGGSGTNALAMRNARGVDFVFGPQSQARFRQVRPACKLVRRPGFLLDIEERADLNLAVQLGHLSQWAAARAVAPWRD